MIISMWKTNVGGDRHERISTDENGASIVNGIADGDEYNERRSLIA
jgi:hypothetical protein